MTPDPNYKQDGQAAANGDECSHAEGYLDGDENMTDDQAQGNALSVAMVLGEEQEKSELSQKLGDLRMAPYETFFQFNV